MNLEEKYRNYRKKQVGLHKEILEEFVSADDYLNSLEGSYSDLKWLEDDPEDNEVD